MDGKNLVWMDIMLINLQIKAQWPTLDADVVDLVGVVATVEGGEDADVAAAKGTRRRNGMRIVPDICHPRILTCGIKGFPSQNLAVS